MPRQIVINLPLPPEILHPNARTQNVNYRAAMIKKARGEAEFVSRMAKVNSGWMQCTRAWYSLKFFLPRSRDEDKLDAWLVPYRDGIQDAGLIKNDSGFKLKGIEQITGKSAGGKRGVVITIEMIE